MASNSILSWLLCSLLLFANVAVALDLDLDSPDSIKSVASTIAYDMMSYYKGNLSGQTPGILPGPPPNPDITNAGYFWWEAGGMWGALIDYWYYTGDTTYNDVVRQALLFQVGSGNDYLPQNQTNGMGNDDQGFWGMAAMTAAELGFENPDPSQPQWLALVQAVYNTQLARFDNVCGGGLRWQAYNFLNGYNYKNSIANGCFFNIAARLALYTGNASYATTAESTFDWMQNIGFMSKTWMIYDGADTSNNCTVFQPQQYSYNAGIFLHGAATMYNYTNGSALWQERVQGLLNATLEIFFPNDIGFEAACEAALIHCDIDMLSYKAYLTRWMAAVTKIAPFTAGSILPVLKTSAAAAALQCSGSPADRPNGRMCGLSWYKKDVWDGTAGVGQQMGALEVIQSNLITQSTDILSASNGGTSKGDPSAGINDASAQDPTAAGPITTRDRVGAGFLTAAVVSVVLSGLVWVSLPDRTVL